MIRIQGFGEPIGDPWVLDLPDLIKSGAKGTVALITGSALGVACGGAMGLVLGGSVGVTAFLIDEYVKQKILGCMPRDLVARSLEEGLGVYSEAALRVIDHVTESFEWKKELIRSAAHSVEISANFAGGESLQELLALVREQMICKTQLRVHLLLSRDLLEKNDLLFLDQLSRDYPDRFFFLVTGRIFSAAPFWHTEENHAKMVIVDEQYFVVGGTGIHPRMAREVVPPHAPKGTWSAQLLDEAFHDADIVGYGPIAQAMRRQFFALFQKWEGGMCKGSVQRFFAIPSDGRATCRLFHHSEGLFQNVRIKFLVCGPEHRRDNPITREYERCIRSSEREIRLAHLSFAPPTSIAEAFRCKKEAGVVITGVFNSVGKTGSLIGHCLYALPSRKHYSLVTKAYEYVDSQLYHKKVATFDGRYTIIGSYNLGFKSGYCDDEIICVIEDERVTRVFNETIDRDQAHAVEAKSCGFASALGAGVFRAVNAFFS